MRKIKPTKDEARRKNALSAGINAKAITEKVILRKDDGKGKPTSFRLSPELLEALKKYIYSDKNTDNLNRTQAVERAIADFIGYEGE